MSDNISQDIIAAILSNASKTFEWAKKSSTWKTMLKYITEIAKEEFNISLSDLEYHSIRLAKEMTPCQYEIAVNNYYWNRDEPELIKKYQSIPYIFCPGQDGITTVVFNHQERLPTCDIKKITYEMMEIIKYLGLVRMYITEGTQFTIPFLPDNIIHLEIYDPNVMKAIDKDDCIALPRYLRGFIDNYKNYNIHFENPSYIYRLPDTLINLHTPYNNCLNLPQNMLYYKLSFYTSDSLFNSFYTALLPHNLERFIITTKSNMFNSTYTNSGFKITTNIIEIPKILKYLELPIQSIETEYVIFNNIKKLFITQFCNFIRECHIQTHNHKHLINIHTDVFCINCNKLHCKAFIYNTNIILNDCIENLILDFNYSIQLLELITIVPSNLIITIKVSKISASYVLKHYGLYDKVISLPIISSDNFNNYENYQNYNRILNFQQKYQYVSFIFEHNDL